MTTGFQPLAIDLFCGLGGWTDGLLAEGYDVVGFDIERHVYGEHRYPAKLVIQDVLTLHGSQFRNAHLIVASPPCQKYSYMAMPWTKAKALADEYRSGVRDVKELNALFDACFRIQKEACEAAGRHIPLLVENVRGAIPWVGYSRYNFGSFHLWGDVPALMPMTSNAGRKTPGFRFDGSGKSFQTASVEATGTKAPGMDWSDPKKRGQDFTRVAGKIRKAEGVKNPNGDHIRDGASHTRRLTNPDESGAKNGSDWFGSGANCSLQRTYSSKSNGRKFASAMIAKIPLTLSRHIAKSWHPSR